MTTTLIASTQAPATPTAGEPTCPACHGTFLVVSYGRNVLCGLCNGDGSATLAACEAFLRASETMLPVSDYDEDGTLILLRFEDNPDHEDLLDALTHDAHHVSL